MSLFRRSAAPVSSLACTHGLRRGLHSCAASRLEKHALVTLQGLELVIADIIEAL
jgi:hypothetical protein